MERLERWAAERLALEEPLVLAGDYNVIPRAGRRAHSRELGQRRAVPAADPAGVPPACQSRLHRRRPRGHRRADIYTFWDYQAGAWQKNNGIRIDHLLLSPEAADRLASASIEKHVRAWEKPSDHVPVAIELR